MPANWSLILNVLLLLGVMGAIGNMLKSRRKNMPAPKEPSLGPVEQVHNDDIIAVRKIVRDEVADVHAPVVQASPVITPKAAPSEERKPSFTSAYKPESPVMQRKPVIGTVDEPVISLIERKPSVAPCKNETAPSLMMFLLAKENRQLAGYELLQTVLASGLRFGDGHLFHRHQHANGQGPVLCSLAAATPTGVFDLQNIGAFRVRGLCLFMQASGNSTIDAERFEIMLDTAKQLSEGLDAQLLDDQQKPLTDASIARYATRLKLDECEAALA